MSSKDEVRAFLMSRRANITPSQTDLQDFGGQRRVPGLRRSEVAMLAGVSLDYYTRLERGNLRGASEHVLNALANALQLNELEREYLYGLARTATALTAAGTAQKKPVVRESVQRILDSMSVPAVVWNRQHDLVASNLMGRALYSPQFESDSPNLARFIFLDPRAKDYYVDWPLARQMTAAMLRMEAGRDPLNAELTALIGELSTRSPEFRSNWAERDVHEHRTGRKLFKHPVVGVVDVTYDVFEMPGEKGLWIGIYSVEEGSESAEKFALLASWAATNDQLAAQRLAPPSSGHPNRNQTPAQNQTLTAKSSRGTGEQ
jgi:transcriptional regulator with XRE-family HTH domain